MGHMGERRAAVIAWSAFGLTVAFGIWSIVFGILDHGTHIPEVGGDVIRAHEAFGFAIMTVAFAGLGALLASRRPRNPIGWILVISPTFLGYTEFARDWYLHTQYADPGSLPEAAYLAWAANWGWVIGFVPLLTLLLLLFPDGRPPSRRWRPVAWLGGAALTLLVVGYALAPGRLEDYPRVENPLGVGSGDGSVFEVFMFAGFPLFALAAIGSMASLVVRFRRSHGVERQQLKWMAAAAALVVVSWLLSAFFDQVLAIDISILILLSLLALPAAATVSVLRYRLYDLDLVVNRTLVYGALTATLAASYLGLVLLFQAALDPLTQESDLAIAASTLGVAALFRPARARIQALVDRRFYRRRYDRARTVEEFGVRVRDEVELDSLSEALRGVTRETMQPAHVSLWLRAPERT
jgi:hypothetical protein